MPINQDKNFPPVRVTDKLRQETQKCAEIEDEKLSEYIKKAVEDRNKKVLKKVKNIYEEPDELPTIPSHLQGLTVKQLKEKFDETRIKRKDDI